MDFDLNSDQKNYRDLAKTFSEKELKPFAALNLLPEATKLFFPSQYSSKTKLLINFPLYIDTWSTDGN